MVCELCETIKKPGKIYFETEEILVMQVNENLIVGVMKEHVDNISFNKLSGLIKIMLLKLGRGCDYTFRNADCEGHTGIYATIHPEK